MGVGSTPAHSPEHCVDFSKGEVPLERLSTERWGGGAWCGGLSGVCAAL